MLRISRSAKNILLNAKFSSTTEGYSKKFNIITNFYRERQSFLEDDTSIESPRHGFDLIPYYLEYLNKNFDEITFALSTAIVSHEIYQVKNEKTTALSHQYKDELFKILYNNINKITKLNTITSSLKKILILGYPLSDQIKSEFAKKTLELIDKDKKNNYSFTDQGSLATFAILMFLRIGYKDTQFYLTYSDYVAKNAKKIRTVKLIGGYFALSKIPLSMSPETHDNIVKELKLRSKIIGLDGAAKFMEGFIDVVDQVSFSKTFDKYELSLNNSLELIAEIVTYEIISKRPLTIESYCDFIFLVLKSESIFKYYKKDSKAIIKLENAFNSFLNKLILKSDPVHPNPIPHIKTIAEVLPILKKYDLKKYLPKPQLVPFIQSIILSLNQSNMSLNFTGSIENIAEFLLDHSDIIKSEKIDCRLNSEAYERLLDVVFGDVQKLGPLTKGNQ